MNTNLNTYEEIQAAYDEMMASDSELMIDPVLMVGYIDNRDEKERISREGMVNEIANSQNAKNRLDQITIAKFFGIMFATIAIGNFVVASCEWLVSLV